MVTLEVGMDAKGLLQGSREAFTALNSLGNSVQNVVTLLENVSGSAGALGKFGTVLARWQPLLVAITTGLSAINLVMGLTSRTTDQAKTAWDSYATAIDKANQAIRAAQILGISAIPGLQAQQQNLQALAGNLTNDPMSAAQFAKSTGLGVNDVMRYLASQGDQGAADAMRSGGSVVREFGIARKRIAPGDIMLSPEQQRAMVVAQYRDFQGSIDAQQQSRGGGPDSPYGLGPMFRPGTDNYGGVFTGMQQWNGVEISDQQRGDMELDAARKLDREMALMEQRAARIGDTLASGFLRAATGAASVREIIGEMLMDVAQSFLAEGFSAAARGFMATPTQRAG